MAEILDSTVELVPHIFVNGKQYSFSETVMMLGQELHFLFEKLNKLFKKQFLSSKFENFVSQNEDPFEDRNSVLVWLLSDFDIKWTQFESRYTHELMYIESEPK